MTDEELTEWIQAWSKGYHVERDQALAPYHGAKSLDRAAALTVVDWKFSDMAHRRANARRRLAMESDAAIVDVTAAARACSDDDAAMRVMRVLRGVGPALGSAVLMTMDPHRWTVLDVRAAASVKAIGYTEIPKDSQNPQAWLPYLLACRDIRRRTGTTLRDVDRALYRANGKERLPAGNTLECTTLCGRRV